MADWTDEAQMWSERERDASLARALANARAFEPVVSSECLDCGGPIGVARMMAQPRAQRCVDCQDVAETKGGRR